MLQALCIGENREDDRAKGSLDQAYGQSRGARDARGRSSWLTVTEIVQCFYM